MPTNLLLLPLMGGYWFLHTFRVTRFRMQRLDGYRLLVESAAAGLALSVVAWIVVGWLTRFAWIRDFWSALSPGNMPFLGTATLSCLLGLASPYVANWICERTGWIPAQVAQYEAIFRYGNHLLRLLHTAQNLERLVSITLDNNKVYIGTIAGAPNLEAHDSFVALIPFFSGYRKQDTRQLVLTVDYLSVYEREGLDPTIFTVVLPIPSIRIASYFDQKIYSKFELEAEAPEEPGA